MSTEPETTDVDERLGELFEGIRTFREKSLIQSAMRLTQEARRLAKAERRLVHYLNANFYVMTLTQDLFDAEAGRDAAVENIALLESPERARAFQGDYDESDYERTVQWMSACSYDNLATATGILQGYNSPGMQACIADGISVCRRTGKLQCVTCFREYATAVHRSADDLAMAMHHARTNLTARPDAETDRRCLGARDLADLLLLAGHLEPAYQAASESLQLAESYHTPLRARRMARVLMRQIGHLAGKAEWVEAGVQPAGDRTSRGEDPSQDLREELADAVGDAARGDIAAAIERLTPWDTLVSNRKCWHWWFEVRLHLVAMNRLAGKADRAAALARPLEKRARESDDFLTLRRLSRILSPDEPAAPFPAAAPLKADSTTAPPSATPAAAEPSASATIEKAPQDAGGPLRPVVERIGGELAAALQAAAESEQPPDFAPLAEQVLAIPPADVAHPEDAARLLHLLVYLAQAPAPAERVWAWARAVGERHPADAKVTAIRAQLGDILRSADDSPLAQVIGKEELEAMFRRSMELDPQWAGAFRRAGAFFLGEGNEAEAERCLARAFRLDRTDPRVASQLADVYAATDRPGDALAVLDMCLREGTESPDLLWQAGTRAAGLGRHESALTYLDRLEQLEPGRPWVHYYRAVALLALGRPAEAADAAELEAERIGRADALHLHSLRAAAAAQAGRTDDVRRHLQAALAVPLGSIEDLTITGIASCHERLWQAALALPEQDGTRLAVVERLLASGLTPEAMWDWHRAQAAEVKDLTHYLVDLRQPLGPEWPALRACPPGGGTWQAYVIRYGVLAASEDEARAAALKWQARSSLRPAEVLAVEAEGGPYKDRPGVTWRTQPAEDE